MFERVAELEREYHDLEGRLADPDLLADQRAYTAVARRYKELEAVVECAHRLAAAEEDLAAARELISGASAEDRDLLRDEVEAGQAAVASLAEELRLLLLPSDPNAGKDVIVEIRGAEGGEEANLFARDLYDMYAAFALRHGWRLEVLSSHPSDLGGYSEITFELVGDDVWSHMKYEGGPHRVQRVPVTESQGRVHTSSATVTVLPEADEVEVVVDPNDLQVDVFRSSGPGGQSVNTTDSAVRITHKPTGIVVSMQDEKSQLQNRAKALTVLRARLLQQEQDRQSAELSGARRAQIGGGGRSEKVRTYNFKENRLTDHRIGLTLYKLDRVLAGDLDEVVGALAADERSHQLAASGDAA